MNSLDTGARRSTAADSLESAVQLNVRLNVLKDGATNQNGFMKYAYALCEGTQKFLAMAYHRPTEFSSPHAVVLLKHLTEAVNTYTFEQFTDLKAVETAQRSLAFVCNAREKMDRCEGIEGHGLRMATKVASCAVFAIPLNPIFSATKDIPFQINAAALRDAKKLASHLEKLVHAITVTNHVAFDSYAAEMLRASVALLVPVRNSVGQKNLPREVLDVLFKNYDNWCRTEGSRHERLVDSCICAVGMMWSVEGQCPGQENAGLRAQAADVGLLSIGVGGVRARLVI